MRELKKPLVSLIITCHNLGKYLLECVKSIENQTYKNFEIIIVDDGSDEDTKAIIEKHFKNKGAVAKFFDSTEIRIIETVKNEGQLGAFLQGLKVARGEFICMIDADDVLFEDYLALHLQVHMNTNVAFTSASQAEIDADGVLHSLYSMASPAFKNKDGIYKKIAPDKIFDLNQTDFEVKIIDQKQCPFGTWAWNPSTSAMMRKSALEFLLLYKNTKIWTTGADKFIFSFLNLLGGSALISAPLFAYRRHCTNFFGTNPLIGNFRYLKPKSVEMLIKWNKTVRLETLKFIAGNYSFFCSRLNPMNTKRLIFAVLFSFNLHTIKKALKALIFKLS